MSFAIASGSTTPRNASTSIAQVTSATQLEKEHQIALLDHTQTQEEEHPEARDDLADLNDSETDPPTPSAEYLLKKRNTRDSLHQELTRRKYNWKYARFGEGRYAESSDDAAPQEGDVASPAQKGYLERGRAAAQGIIPSRRKKAHKHHSEEDAVMEILYENQRGAFLFGVPFFSSSSLLNLDPKAWLNANMRTSPVDITNAQVPDPSWEWAWKSWYVDMSRDVDEEGWEYSLGFRENWAWHGTHPWFHSFVRRRRWLRRRVRKHGFAKDKTGLESHMLTADYFTIHPTRTRSPDSSLRTASFARMQMRIENDVPIEQQEIHDVTALIKALKKAAVDREKVVAVRKFIEEGGDELYYLAEQMPHIMNMFIFQSSRRQLLADLMHRFDSVSKRQASLATHEHGVDEDAQKEHDTAQKQAENLLNAVRAADDQVKKLEYWSDIKGMAHNGDLLTEDDKPGGWNAQEWAGLDASGPLHEEAFASKQPSHIKAHEPHKHPEHSTEEEMMSSPPVKSPSVESPSFRSPSVKSPVENFQDALSTTHSSDDTGFTTAAESPTEARRKTDKGKGRAN